MRFRRSLITAGLLLAGPLALSACAALSGPSLPEKYHTGIYRKQPFSAVCEQDAIGQLVSIKDPSKGCPSQAYARPVIKVPGLGLVEAPPPPTHKTKAKRLAS